jgi:hypothetical protein
VRVAGQPGALRNTWVTPSRASSDASNDPARVGVPVDPLDPRDRSDGEVTSEAQASVKTRMRAARGVGLQGCVDDVGVQADVIGPLQAARD